MFSFLTSGKTQMVTAENALRGRDAAIMTPGKHHVSGRPIGPPYPDGLEVAIFGMGCFWGAERVFWETPGVWVTAVGYAGGFTPNPTYDEACSAKTGHTEVVQVVFDPAVVTYTQLLALFWESHNPTQGMRQGNDVGTQYRSFLGTTTQAQREAAGASRDTYAAELGASGFGDVTTDIVAGAHFWFAEDYHQQYLAKNPNGYCGLQGTGVTCPIPVRPQAAPTE